MECDFLQAFPVEANEGRGRKKTGGIIVPPDRVFIGPVRFGDGSEMFPEGSPGTNSYGRFARIPLSEE
jgi:hypothetical protein